jgi:hypothetical protein
MTGLIDPAKNLQGGGVVPQDKDWNGGYEDLMDTDVSNMKECD